MLVTTDFVVDETLTLLRFRLGLPAAETWWRQIARSERVRWERVDASRFDKARELFFQYRDKDFSFTDCTSFALMERLRIKTAFSFDAHFKQYGLTKIPE